MKISNYLIICMLLLVSSLNAQTVPEGIHYQVLFRGKDGQPLVNQVLQMEIKLGTDTLAPEIYYQELHDVETNHLGLAKIIIGQGTHQLGTLREVPWASGNIWLSISWLEGGRFREITRNELLSVPYAMHAASAKHLTEEGALSLRNDNSLYWLTGGNSKTIPNVDFLGTIDNQDIYIKTNGITRYILDKNGLLTIHGDQLGEAFTYTDYQGNTIQGIRVPFGQENKAAYPLVIERAQQGVYIELDTNWPDRDNHFVSFATPEGIYGAIQGERIYEKLFLNGFVVLQTALLAAEITFTIFSAYAQFQEAGSLGTDLIGLVPAAGAVANGIAQGVAAGKLAIFRVTEYLFLLADMGSLFEWPSGVAYKSGGADYAEWLPRSEACRDLRPGEVVGLKHGEISLNTDDAERIMVVSQNPIVVGNLPPVSQQHAYEKVTFMGQVFVTVLGPVSSGDFLLPSGHHDGFAIAVHPQEIKTGDYGRIIGVAWESSSDQLALAHSVRTAVGINANDMSQRVAQLELRTQRMVSRLRGENPLAENEWMKDLEEAMTQMPIMEQTKWESSLTPAEFDELIAPCEWGLKKIYQQLEAELVQQGLQLDQHPALQAAISDPVAQLKALKRDERYAAQIATFELALLGLQQQNPFNH